MTLEDFREYCEENQCSNPVSGSSEHDRAAHILFSNPHFIGLRDIAHKYREVAFYSKAHETVTATDMIFFLSRDQLPYICEVKTGWRTGQGAIAQLEKQYDYVRDRFGILPIRMSIRCPPNGQITRNVIPAELKDVMDLLARERALKNQKNSS